ncbi:MAG TPA: serine/threonine-protein kinase [Hyphomicrobiaceae bacterium]|nr:serine/threonine-protein kinase [Hyphomicrobiaceae bacterium]
MNDDQDRSDLGTRVPLSSGTRIEHYIIERVLGAGGFGITYLAEHARLGKKYAIKEYFPEAFGHREGDVIRAASSNGQVYRRGLDSFINEAKALAQFKHPAILDVAGIVEANGTAYIIFAFEKGRTLKAWLQELGRRPSQFELDRLLEPLLDALVEIHQHNLLHRDIAPDNILIRDQGTPVLIDFGAAREAIRDRPNAMSAIIKQGYSPPEQYSTRPGMQGPWTDVYGMAATLHEAITGAKPPDAMNRMIEDSAVSLRDWASLGYRAEFLAAIDTGLRLRPEDRPQAIAVWREQLFQGAGNPFATSERRIRVRATGPGTPARPSPRRTSVGLHETSAHLVPSGSSSTYNGEGTGRPDLSALDDGHDAKSFEGPPTSQAAQSLFRTFWVLIVSTLGGSIAGWLSSFLIASVVAASCTGDSCLSAYLLPCTVTGAAAGLAAGFYILRSSGTPGSQSAS